MKLASTIVAAIIAEATAARSQKADEPKNEKKDPRADAIRAIFDNGSEPFGCHTKPAAALVEAMTGIKIKLLKGNRVPQFHVVVPINETEGHKHTIGKPIISLELSEGRCLSSDGAWQASYTITSEVRPATDEEFKAMMDFLNENKVKVYNWIYDRFGLKNVFPVE